MKNIIAYSIVLFCSLVISCSNDGNECGLIGNDVFMSDPALRFDLINETTGNNIFADKLFEPSFLKIANTDNLSEEIEYWFLNTDSYIISIDPILLTPDVKNYTFILSDEVIFKLETDKIIIDCPGCCSNYSYSKIDILEAEFNMNSQNGNFEILID